jgi:hypothetical protein
MNRDLERKFLHDIAGPICILRIQVGIIIDELEKEPTSEFNAKLKNRLEKLLKAAHKLEVLHGDHKIAISSKKEAA